MRGGRIVQQGVARGALRSAAEPVRRTLLQPSERARRGLSIRPRHHPDRHEFEAATASGGPAVIVAIRPQGGYACSRPEPANSGLAGRIVSRHFPRRDRAFRRGGGGRGVLSPGKGARRRRVCSGRGGQGEFRSARRAGLPGGRRALRLMGLARFAIVRPTGGQMTCGNEGFWRPTWVVFQSGTGSS